MTEQELKTYCEQNGIPCETVRGLRVMDMSRLPDVLKTNLDEQGYYGGAKVSTEAVEVKLTGKIPEDFPGHAALEAEGITTFAKLRKVSDLTAIPGIGEATAEKIRAALEEGE